MHKPINFIKGSLLNFDDNETSNTTNNESLNSQKKDIASLYRQIISSSSTAKKEPDDVRNPLTFYINRQIKKENLKNKNKSNSNDIKEVNDISQLESKKKTSVENFYCEICKMTINVPKKQHIHGIPHILSNKKLTNNGNQAEFHLKEDNIGYKLLVKQGWDEQSGLGSKEDGRLYPVRINYKHDKKGIGIKEKPIITSQQLKDAKLLAASKAEKLHNKLNYENKYSTLLVSNNNNNKKNAYKGDTISREEYSILSNMHHEFESNLPNPSPTVPQLRKHQRIIETLELAKIKGLNIPSNSYTNQGKTLNKAIQKPRINKKKDFKNKIKKEENSRLKLLEYLKH